ncbi:hypothetical protein KF840_09780 [bacterium]|nr:hypothetical protein [bacterium]
MSPAPSPRPRRSLWSIWAPLPLLVLVLLDWTFPLYFWRIPKITGRAADYGYQFLYDVSRMGPKAEGAVRILACGSSVAGAFDPAQVQGLLQARFPDVPIDVQRLLKPSMKPSDYRLFLRSELSTLQPDIVLLMVNLQDFLHSNFEREIRPDVQAVLPPWPTLRERYPHIPLSDSLALLLASGSNFFRYRQPLRSSIEDHARALVSWARSPAVSGGYGVYPDGYARRRFGIPVQRGKPLDLDYFIDPAWIAQRGAVRLDFRLGRTSLATRSETTPGWKTVHLDLPGDGTAVLQVSSDSAWNRRAAGLADDLRLLGVRLRAAPGAPPDGGPQPFHYPPTDQRDLDAFLRMGGATGAAYAERWQAALARDDDFGGRLRAWRDTRLALRDTPFAPTDEFRELAGMVDELAAQGTAVILVNTPENPLMTEYQHGAYYQGYRDFFRRLAEAHPGVWFVDLLDSLPAQDFNDLMHATYIGVITLGPTYADVIAEVMRARGLAPASPP